MYTCIERPSAWRGHSARAGLVAALAATMLAGCASVRVDADGRRHVAGWVWLTLPPPAGGPPGAETLRVRSLGLTVSSGPLGQSAVFGWSDQSLTAIRNDAAVWVAQPQE